MPGEIGGAVKKYISILLTNLLLLAGCSSVEELEGTEQPNLAPTRSQQDVASAAACRNLELNLIQTSLVFDETLSGVGTAYNKDAIQFFQGLNELSQQVLSLGGDAADINEELSLAANGFAEVILDVQGLISSEFSPSEVSQILRPAVQDLFSLCLNWADIKTSPDELFEAPELITFDLTMYEDVDEEPAIMLLSDVGWSWRACDFNYGPELVSSREEFPNIAKAQDLRPFIQVVCNRLDKGYVVIRRYESNLEALNWANIMWELDGESGSVTILLSDQFTIVGYAFSEDKSFLETVKSWTYVLEGFEVYEGK